MPKYPDDKWDDAKRRCQLTDDDLRKAKQLGMTPRSLIKNIPSRQERWKAPVADWVRSLHAKRFGSDKVHLISVPKAQMEEGPEDVPIPEAPPETREYELQQDPFGPPYNDLLPDLPAWSEAAASGGETLDETGLPTSWSGHRQSLAGEPRETEAGMYRRQEEFRLAAEYVARAFAHLPEVAKVELFGSVASKLKKEIPRFSRLRGKNVRIAHECNDVDLAVYLTRLDNLKALQRARGLALNLLFADREIGVRILLSTCTSWSPRPAAIEAASAITASAPSPAKTIAG